MSWRFAPTALRLCSVCRISATRAPATPSFPTIAAIADVLGLSLDAVWAEINQPDRGVEPTGAGHNARERLAS